MILGNSCACKLLNQRKRNRLGGFWGKKIHRKDTGKEPGNHAQRNVSLFISTTFGIMLHHSKRMGERSRGIKL